MNEDFTIIYPPQPLAKSYEFGLVLTTYNRPMYLHRTLASIRRSDLRDTVLFLVDDISDHPITKVLLKRFDLWDVPVIKAFRKEKEGCMMYENLKFGWDFLLKEFNCNYLINLDPDAIVKKKWLSHLKETHQLGMAKYEGVLVTGFNAYQHPVLEETENYYVKKSLGGINFFFDKKIYSKIIRPVLIDLQWDDHVVAALTANDYPIIGTKPSVVQHIGRSGLWSGTQNGTFDFAVDFGDTNPTLMKWRLFYFQTSKKLLGNIIRFYNYRMQWLKQVLITLFFYRLYLGKKKKQ